MRVLGVNAVFHDPAAALVVDGQVVAAAEEERFTRRKHGKLPVPFATWELPERSAAWCLAEAGLAPEDLDAVAYSYDPALAPPVSADLTDDGWEGLRTLYAERAPLFLRTALPGLDPACVRYVPHHVAHAASAHLAAPYPSSSVLVLDGRGEAASHLAGRSVDGDLEVLAAQRLPHSLGLLYEEVTDHLGFRRSSDEYKVMALAAYGRPPTCGSCARRSGSPATAASPSPRSSWAPWPSGAARARSGPASTPTWRPASSSASRRCCWSWSAGCTPRPATAT
jgi:carbamoyltransferase